MAKKVAPKKTVSFPPEITRWLGGVGIVLAGYFGGGKSEIQSVAKQSMKDAMLEKVIEDDSISIADDTVQARKDKEDSLDRALIIAKSDSILRFMKSGSFVRPTRH